MRLISSILEEKRLSQTATRKAILEVLMNSAKAMTEKEIQENMRCDCDRSTVYRSLRTFQEKGIIHEVMIDNVSRFALVESHEDIPEHHAHFRCETCGEITCLYKVTLSLKELPRGFSVRNHTVLISGICNECTKIKKEC